MTAQLALSGCVTVCTGSGSRVVVGSVPRRATRAPLADHGIETVVCQQCGKLLRRRLALTMEQPAYNLPLRWAAAQLEVDPMVLRVKWSRKGRSDADELYALGKLAAADKLREWARTIHRRPPLREAQDGSRVRHLRASGSDVLFIVNGGRVPSVAHWIRLH